MNCSRISRDVSFAFFGVAFLFFLISFGAPYWVDTEKSHAGLWSFCVKDLKCYFMSDFNVRSFVHATQAMMCLALIADAVSLLTFLMWMAFSVDELRKGPGIPGVAAVFSCFIAGVLNLIGVAVFAGQYTIDVAGADTLSWAWYLGLFSAIITFLDGLITLIVVTFRSYDRPPVDPPPTSAVQFSANAQLPNYSTPTMDTSPPPGYPVGGPLAPPAEWRAVAEDPTTNTNYGYDSPVEKSSPPPADAFDNPSYATERNATEA